MKNKKYYHLIIVLFWTIFFTNINYADDFEFNVTEIEILENGNLYKGLKRGTIQTNDGLLIDADEFIYNKLTNILEAEGNVKVNDINEDVLIFSDKITYHKNDEIIFTSGNSKAIDKKTRIITAEKFNYKIISQILNARGRVKIENLNENYLIQAEDITYIKKEEKIFTKGYTEADIEKKYKVKSEDVSFILSSKVLSSKFKTTLEDNNSQIYYLDEFIFLINENILKGKNILTITNYNLPKSDKFYFSDAIINLKNKSFVGKDTKVEIHKDIFATPDNDPRIYGVSSTGNEDKTVVNKAIFTSCKKNKKCTPWSIKANKIEHDKKIKQITYQNAILNLYDVPILYFPKFFHPDPTVKRQSGLLKPLINKSNVLGSSLTVPYYKVISNNKDFTFAPTWFDNKILMSQNEFRQDNKNSELITDFGFVKGYKSPTTKEKNSLSHIFSRFKQNLNLENFLSSDLLISMEQVSNDTYLKVFDEHITKSNVRPSDLNVLKNQIKLSLNHEKFNFNAGVEAYENLQLINNDRYEYVLPYYNFDTVLEKKFFDGSINFYSTGSNTLNNTNNLKSNIINDLNYTSQNYLTNFGFISNYEINLKNLNSIGKNNPDYKSSPQIELVSLFNATSSLPLIKRDKYYNNYLTPKVSFRFNPSDMKNYSTSNNKINISNIFATNRLGINDTFESGRSLTLGLDYKREQKDLEDVNKFFEIKLATVLRDKEESFISTSSTINRKSSNLFGSIKNNFSEKISFDYNFALDNDLNKFEYNDVSTTLSINNLITKFSFIEENGEMGDSNVFENSISYKIDENNQLSFKTRRNRKINLTEYYDLVYEYKNDCLTAGIKYKKSYYEDRDLKPTENLLFTITLFPLTTYEYEADELLEN